MFIRAGLDLIGALSRSDSLAPNVSAGSFFYDQIAPPDWRSVVPRARQYTCLLLERVRSDTIEDS